MNGPAGGFAGDLGAFGLADLIQTIALGGRTGRLTIRTRSAVGELWFREGSLLHAEVGPLSGEPAVYEMLGWTEGDFTVEYGPETVKRSIEQEATVLVLEGLRRLDERGIGGETSTPEVQSERRTRKPRGRGRSAAGTIVILAAAVTAVAWIAAARGSSRPPRVLGDLDASGPSLPPAPAPIEVGPLPLDPPEPTAGPDEERHRPTPSRRPPAKPVPRVTLADEEIEAFFATPSLPDFLPVVRELPANEPAPSASLRLLGKSYVGEGGIRIFVDGQVVFARSLAQQRGDFSRAMRRLVAAGDERFEAEIPVVSGTRDILVEVDLGDDVAVQRESARVEFAEGSARTLRVTAGRAVGQPVKIRFD